MVLFLSALAYFAAIGLKVLVQSATYGWIESAFGTVSVPTGLYFGLQTTFFEVGLAYLVARIAVSRWRLEARDGEGYGVSLAFWENAVLLGVLPLLSLVLTYFLIADDLLSPPLYQILVKSDPSAFYAPLQLAAPLALGVLERFSSFLMHFSWGYLCVLSAYLRKRSYLLLALPMGLVDAIVPFASEVPLWEFESLVFLISLVAFALTWRVTREDRRRGYAKEITSTAPIGFA